MSKVEVTHFLIKRKESLTEKAQECDANKENPVHQQFLLQVIKHWVLGVLNFKGQVIKTSVLGSKPNMAGYQTQKRTEQSSWMKCCPNSMRHVIASVKMLVNSWSYFIEKEDANMKAINMFQTFPQLLTPYLATEILALRQSFLTSNMFTYHQTNWFQEEIYKLKLVKVQEEVEKEEQDIKDHLNSLYSKSD